MSDLIIREKVKAEWIRRGWDVTKVRVMGMQQIYALYYKYCADYHSIKENEVVVEKKTERDYWSDKEWDDYAFEE